MSAFLMKYGPWAVVTGASSGIGEAMARELAAAGLNLFLVARREAVLQALAQELRERFAVDVDVLVADLAGPQGHEALVEATATCDVGLLVAAAGFGIAGPFCDNRVEGELEMLDVNCAAVLRQAHYFSQRFVARGRGGLVLMGSLVGRQGAPHASHYAATKAYVQTLAEGLHAELRSRGVDVVASAPGPVHSGFARRAGMTMSLATTPQSVATGTLRALGRRAVAVPGILSKGLTFALAWLPRTARVWVMGRIMLGMTRGRHAA